MNATATEPETPPAPPRSGDGRRGDGRTGSFWLSHRIDAYFSTLAKTAVVYRQTEGARRTCSLRAMKSRYVATAYATCPIKQLRGRVCHTDWIGTSYEKFSCDPRDCLAQ